MRLWTDKQWQKKIFLKKIMWDDQTIVTAMLKLLISSEQLKKWEKKFVFIEKFEEEWKSDGSSDNIFVIINPQFI